VVIKRMKLKAIILRNELEDDHVLWVKACEDNKKSIEYRIVNLTASNWLEEIRKEPFDILLAKPGGLTAPFKQLYDERVYILGKVLFYNIFPSPEEIFIYENKRFLSYWLKANNIPHPATFVFYNRNEAMEFAESCLYPLVAKANIGASGSGVIILHTKKEADDYIKHTFSAKGAPKRSGPNLDKGELLARGLHYIVHPNDIQKKLSIYRSIRCDIQADFVIFQEFIEHDFEWRVVRIGESFFAHKKLKIGEKASGSLIKVYENPPLLLLDFVKKITDKHQFYSQAIDVFESKQDYLVNEMQCIFGQSDTHQMQVNETPGRYVHINDNWIFEGGSFCENACFNLRISFIIERFSKNIQSYEGIICK
jgi:glutathione synthase/RimK-type ligase-like ATP-grasp enzyme